MMPGLWDRHIRGLWGEQMKRFGAAMLVVLAAARLAAGSAPPAGLAHGVKALEKKAYAEAVRHLRGLPARYPPLADYAAYWLGQAYFEQKDYGAAAGALALSYRHPIGSPVTAPAVLLAAECQVALAKPQEALALLRDHYAKLPAPQRDAALAKAFEAAGDLVSAAVSWQRIYYSYPTSSEAEEAEAQLRRLADRLSDKFPPPLGQAMLERAQKLAQSKRFAQARWQLEQAVRQLGGAERDLAQVRLGVVHYQAREDQRAYSYMRDLSVDSAEAQAERLQYLVLLARRLNRESDMHQWLEELAARHPHSRRRLEALLAVANQYLLRNDPARYMPLYQVCADQFRNEPEAAYCHWKITWNRYLTQPQEAEPLLKAHIREFPGSEKIPAALYFLGRLAESAGRFADAKAYFSQLNRLFPNHYYATQARERLASRAVQAASVSLQTQHFLRTLPLQARRQAVDFTPSELTRQRLERSRLLRAAGLDDWAEQELRFGARHDGQPHVIAVELARLIAQRRSIDQALRALKTYVPDYLKIPMDEAPEAFWRAAFPLPFRDSLLRWAKARSLDPYLLAGLIRQESEFNPKAVSSARAYGLTQILPSTGRHLSRQTGLRRFSPRMLFQPEVNLRLGTHYLRQLVESLGGSWEQALASYNAGKSRVLEWLRWADFREPAEFIESIPITETRNYVQIVLRNAEVYRKLYGAAATALPSGNASLSGQASRLDSQ